MTRVFWLWTVCTLIGTLQTEVVSGQVLQLTLRDRIADGEAATNYRVRERQVSWKANRSAVVICDMWDDHWCRGAAGRVAEMAEPMNQLVTSLREQGVLVIHAPSSVVAYYDGTPQRRRAQRSPLAQTPVALSTDQRWGTAWCWPDPTRETDLPIDDSDMGCDCQEKCVIREAWGRQIDTIEIGENDVITDNGQEYYNILQQHRIENVMIMGVHLNMCVLGRPFGIRQTSKLGKNLVLIRDMTDTMYNHRMKPFVNHFAGTDLVVQHIEKYWCPTITSDQLIGGKPFQFRDAEIREIRP